MRRFIYNTQGAGISHEQIRRLENTQPGSGTYLEGDMNSLGDEIMLLDGMDDMHEAEALQGLGYVGAGNYQSRAGYDMDGFALSEASLATLGPQIINLPARMRPNRARADLRTLKPRVGGRSHPAGRRARRDFAPRGLSQRPEVARAAVSPYTVDKISRPDLFIGPNFYPLEDIPTPSVRRAGRDFEPWGLGAVGPVEYRNTPPPQSFFQAFDAGARLEALDQEPYDRWADTPSPSSWFQGGVDGLGDAASDRRMALSVATNLANLCRSGCDFAHASASQTTEKARCRAGCDAALAAATTTINAALPAGTSGPTTPDASAAIQSKLDALAAAQAAAEAGADPGAAYRAEADEGMSTQTMLLIGGGVLALGLIAVLALRK